MTTIELQTIQMNILKHCKICQDELDLAILLMNAELKNLTISKLRREVLNADINRILWIKKSIRDLEINQ